MFSSTSGIAKETTIFYKRLASLLLYKWDQPYSVTMGWLRCTLGFSLLKSSIQCISPIHSKSSCLFGLHRRDPIRMSNSFVTFTNINYEIYLSFYLYLFLSHLLYCLTINISTDHCTIIKKKELCEEARPHHQYTSCSLWSFFGHFQ